ncbi:MAG: fused MFS/spermidine synthase, partial [Polyangia bacterium]|nr:fused MFS/spermidine synthase [Polyangia bacterium]
MRIVRPLAVLLFLCSGASGLMFETLWMRLLNPTFGATTLAISTLLTVFMGGLALGGWLAGAIADRLRRESSVLMVYGLLELVVAAYGIAFPAILGWVHELHGWIWSSFSPGPAAFALLRFAVVGLVLIIPTTAMGATLPVLSRFYARSEVGLGREAGTLYSVNIFGAVSGTFLAGFVLMPSMGLGATNRLACSINLLLCLAAAGLGCWLRRRETEWEATTVVPGRDAAPWNLSWTQKAALVGVAVSGLVAMVYQQVWTRILAQIVGSSVYAFAMILMAFLLGLAVGGAAYSRLMALRPGQMARLGTIHLLVATMVLLGFIYVDRLPEIFLALAQRSSVSPGSIFLLQFLMCSLVVFLPTLFMGMIFPATIAVCADGTSGVGRTVGRVYAINTVGSIVGSFLGGFVMLPLLGSQTSLAVMIVGNLLLAVFFSGLAPLSRRARLLRAGAMGMLLIATLVGVQSRWEPRRMTSGVFRLALHMQGGRDAGCPDASSPIGRLFASGPGAAHVKSARALLGHRPQLWPRCPEIAGAALLHYREGLVATVSTWQTIVEGLEPTTCWESLILQVNGKVDASATGAFRKPPEARCVEYV